MQSIVPSYLGQSIRGLPISKPFKIKTDYQIECRKEGETGIFLILPFQVTDPGAYIRDFCKENESSDINRNLSQSLSPTFNETSKSWKYPSTSGRNVTNVSVGLQVDARNSSDAIDDANVDLTNIESSDKFGHTVDNWLKPLNDSSPEEPTVTESQNEDDATIVKIERDLNNYDSDEDDKVYDLRNEPALQGSSVLSGLSEMQINLLSKHIAPILSLLTKYGSESSPKKRKKERVEPTSDSQQNKNVNNLEKDAENGNQVAKRKIRKTQEETNPELQKLQERKLIKVESEEAIGDKRKSTRLKSIGYRPDYQDIEQKIDQIYDYLGEDIVDDEDKDDDDTSIKDYLSDDTSDIDVNESNKEKEEITEDGEEKNTADGEKKNTADDEESSKADGEESTADGEMIPQFDAKDYENLEKDDKGTRNQTRDKLKRKAKKSKENGEEKQQFDAKDYNNCAKDNKGTNNRTRKNLKRKAKKTKEDDPDYNPTQIKKKKEEAKKTAKNKQQEEDIENTGGKNDTASELEEKKVKRLPRRANKVKKLLSSRIRSSKIKPVQVKPEVKVKQPKVKVKKVRIQVKLEEHEDKYRKDLFESIARKDRGKSEWERFSEVFVCLLCGKFNSETVPGMERHLESHLNGELDCKMCKFIASQTGELVKHKREMHKSQMNNYICPECGEGYYRQSCYKDHLGNVHNKPQWKCRFCPEPTWHINKKLLRKHKEDSHRDSGFPCEDCDEFFMEKNGYDNHKQKQLCTGRENAFVCDQCGMQLSCKVGLRQHTRRVHLKLRPYHCTECSFKATNYQSLRSHKLVHEGIRPFSCDQCTFSCVQSYQLKSHMRTHNGEKPYKCTKCRYAASWNVSLKDHMKYHSLETAVTCQRCSILFKNERTLSTHMKKEHSMPL